jgi:hypothetical protein
MTSSIKRKSSWFKLAVLAVALAGNLFAGPALAYHPMMTDDPGTTEHRHFELEWGHEFLCPEGSMDDYSGYVAIKSGLAPGLEFDTALGYTMWRDVEDLSASGWGDAELALKWRFLGDGDGPNNLGLEAIFALPSGEEEKDLRGGDEIIPTLFMFGTVGGGDWRVLLNGGITVLPDENDVAVGGLGLEWTASGRLALIGEIYGEGDFERGGGNDPVMASAGAIYGANDWLTLSSGFIFGLNHDAPDYLITLAALMAW